MLIRRPSRYARQCCEGNLFSLERFAVLISVDLNDKLKCPTVLYPLRNPFE